MTTGARLIIFARYPVPGHAKTRLIPSLGTHGSALMQHQLTRKTLAVAGQFVRSRNIGIEVCVAGNIEGFRALYPGPWNLRRQADGDLGDRVASAVQGAFETSEGPVVVIGSDCPTLTAEHLSVAFDSLGHEAVVIGPATDGGYYLIGMQHFSPALFRGIDWSTSRVLAQTRAAGAGQGLSIKLLEVLSDIDRPEDLAALRSPFRPRRIAVTGATGALGMHFIERVLRDDQALQVAAVVRRSSASYRSPRFERLLAQYRDRIMVIDADLRSLRLSPVERDLLCCSDGGLWHLAASTRLRTGNADVDREVWAVNDGGTAALLNLLGSSDRPGPFFHVSTAYVCGERAGTAMEDDRLRPQAFRNSYEASKYAAESRVRDAFTLGLTGAIFRPSVIVGDEPSSGACKVVDVVVEAVIGAAARRSDPLVVALPPESSVNLVHIDWVLEAMILLASGPAERRKTYHLTARSGLRLADLAASIIADHSFSPLILDPAADRRSLSQLSRAVDRALSAFRPYLTTAVHFDRQNLERDAPAFTGVPEFEPSAIVRHRLCQREINTVQVA